MATNRKHIAVYLLPEVEQALIAYCINNGLTAKKGVKFSSGVNAVLSDFFQLDLTAPRLNCDRQGTRTIEEDLLSEIALMEDTLKRLKERIQNGKPVGTHLSVDAGKLNYLLGQYAVLAVQPKTTEFNPVVKMTNASELIDDPEKWAEAQKVAAKNINDFALHVSRMAEQISSRAAGYI